VLQKSPLDNKYLNFFIINNTHNSPRLLDGYDSVN